MYGAFEKLNEHYDSNRKSIHTIILIGLVVYTIVSGYVLFASADTQQSSVSAGRDNMTSTTANPYDADADIRREIAASHETLTVKVLRGIANNLSSIGTNELTYDLNSFRSNLNTMVHGVQEKATKPIGFSILGCFILFAFWEIMFHERQQGDNFVVVPSKLLIRAVLYTILVNRIGIILDAIFALFLGIMGAMQNEILPGLSDSAAISFSGIDFSAFDAEVKAMKTLDSLVVFLGICIGWAASFIACQAAKLVLYGRMLELYLLIAIAPIPVATLPSQEYSGIGKNFFKTYIAGCFQGVVILLIVSFLPALYFGGGIFSMGTGSLIEYMTQNIVFSILVIIMLFSSGRLARSIVGAT